MKFADLARPGLIVLGIAATALLGFAAGAGGSARPRARAAQAREHIGDLWAEAREAAVADVDAADFKRAAGASKASRAAAEGEGEAAARADVGSAPAKKPPRQCANRPNESGVPKKKASVRR